MTSAQLVESMLVGVRATDPLSQGTVAVLLLATALGAALTPGWRATQVNPSQVLRGE